MDLDPLDDRGGTQPDVRGERIATKTPTRANPLMDHTTLVSLGILNP